MIAGLGSMICFLQHAQTAALWIISWGLGVTFGGGLRWMLGSADRDVGRR